MTVTSLRSRLRKFIDQADEKELRAVYSLVMKEESAGDREMDELVKAFDRATKSATGKLLSIEEFRNEMISKRKLWCPSAL